MAEKVDAPTEGVASCKAVVSAGPLFLPVSPPQQKNGREVDVTCGGPGGRNMKGRKKRSSSALSESGHEAAYPSKVNHPHRVLPHDDGRLIRGNSW